MKTAGIDELLDFSDSRDEDYLPTQMALARMRALLEAAPILPNGVAGFCGDACAEWSHGSYKTYHVRLNCNGENPAEDYIYFSTGDKGLIEAATHENLARRLKEFASAGSGDPKP